MMAHKKFNPCHAAAFLLNGSLKSAEIGWDTGVVVWSVLCILGSEDAEAKGLSLSRQIRASKCNPAYPSYAAKDKRKVADLEERATLEGWRLELSDNRPERKGGDELCANIHIMDKVLHEKNAFLERREKRKHIFDEKSWSGTEANGPDKNAVLKYGSRRQMKDLHRRMYQFKNYQTVKRLLDTWFLLSVRAKSNVPRMNKRLRSFGSLD